MVLNREQEVPCEKCFLLTYVTHFKLMVEQLKLNLFMFVRLVVLELGGRDTFAQYFNTFLESQHFSWLDELFITQLEVMDVIQLMR